MGNTPVSEQEIRGAVRNLIAEVTERAPEEISDTALFEDELEVDSLMALEMMVKRGGKLSTKSTTLTYRKKSLPN